MADAYATLSAGGIRNEPIAIKKVVFPDGKSDDLGKPKRKRVLSDGVAYEVTKILEQNMKSGTAVRAQHRLPGGRQDRHHRQLQRRLARGLHAQARYGRVDGLPERAVSMPGVQGPGGRHLPGVDLARLHVGGPRLRLQRLPTAHASRSTSRPSSATTRAPAGGSGNYGGDARLVRHGHRTRAARAATTGGRRAATSGYDPRLYESPPQQAPHSAAAAPPHRHRAAGAAAVATAAVVAAVAAAATTSSARGTSPLLAAAPSSATTAAT